ncbi:MAG: AAA family ATPase [Desulfomonilaceae bacterium]
MGRHGRRRAENSFGFPLVTVSENSEAFLRSRLMTYMQRVMNQSPELDEDIFEALYWMLGGESCLDYLQSIAKLVPDRECPSQDEFETAVDSKESFAERCMNILRSIPKHDRRLAESAARKSLDERLHEIAYDGTSSFEKNIQEFGKIFNLDDKETELCVFLFTLDTLEYLTGHFFTTELDCRCYLGRKWLAVVIDCPVSDLTKVIHSKLWKIGIVMTLLDDELHLDDSMVKLLTDPDPDQFQTEFFRKVKPDAIPLDSHMVDQSATRFILDLLAHKPQTSTHILIYGPPGTGKTSYAYGLAQKLGLTVYLLEHGGKEDHVSRRAAVTACVNVASESDGSLIITDDADAVLNTKDSWTHSGETPDKPWLHEILDKPGVRMIWTVNSVADIEESVARRFSFSLEFKSFNTKQRIQVWQNITRTHKVKRFLRDCDIEDLATRFDTSAGVIEQVVRKVSELRGRSELNFKSSVELALESHVGLHKGDHSPENANRADTNFTLDGLNLAGINPHVFMEEMRAFNEFSKRRNTRGHVSMSLLFHGPPGSGKSALARFVATHLEKEIVFKRASDLLAKYVGETEQNIRCAYEEAHSKGAVLIFDEADSLVFSRDRAEHSWELSFTNEFLTWMESFEGIQIFTTNRLKDLDGASLRRFNYKVEFGYLKPEGNKIFYEKLIAPLVRKSPDNSITKALKGLSGLTPGDFKVVRDRFAFKNKKDVTHKALITALADEARLKALHAGQTRIGFLP